MKNFFTILNNTNLDYIENRKFKFSLAFYCSGFLIFFFIFFQPFGVNNYKYELSITLKWVLEISTFGIPIFIGIYLSEFFIKPLVIKKNVLPGLLPWWVFEFVFIGSASFFHYNLLGNFHDFKWISYILHVINISAVIIVPFAATFFIFRHQELQKRLLKFSNDTLGSKQLFLFTGTYKKDKIALRLEQLLFIEAQDNYVAIYYLERDNLKVHLIRSTLYRIENTLTSKFIVRCHRSFIVNLYQVESFKKNCKKVFLRLKGYENNLQISKKYESTVVELLNDFFITKDKNDYNH